MPRRPRSGRPARSAARTQLATVVADRSNSSAMLANVRRPMQMQRDDLLLELVGIDPAHEDTFPAAAVRHCDGVRGTRASSTSTMFIRVGARRRSRPRCENGALLCERHHTKVHHGFRIERQPDGRWRTYRPDGTEIVLTPRPTQGLSPGASARCNHPWCGADYVQVATDVVRRREGGFWDSRTWTFACGQMNGALHEADVSCSEDWRGRGAPTRTRQGSSRVTRGLTA